MEQNLKTLGFMTHRCAIVVFLFLICLAAVFFLPKDGQSKPPAVVLLPLHDLPPSRARQLAQSALWWIKAWVLPTRKRGQTVVVTGRILQAGPTLLLPEALATHTVSFATNGLKVWLIPTDRLKAIIQELEKMPGTEVLLSPRIQSETGSGGGIASSQSVSIQGTNWEAGVELSCTPNIKADGIDLTALVQCTELQTNNLAAVQHGKALPVLSIQTNLALRTRVMVPAGQGILLVHSPIGKASEKFVAVTLTAEAR